MCVLASKCGRILTKLQQIARNAESGLPGDVDRFPTGAGLGKARASRVRQRPEQGVAGLSNPDSFIDEVTEEVRRDRLFAIFRKYGWIGAVLVLLIVGGAAWNEWKNAQARERAEAFGDAMLDALDFGVPADRKAAIAGIPVNGSQIAVQALMLASDPSTDRAAALAALDGLIADQSQPEVYRDLAVLRRVIIAGAEVPLADRRAALAGIAAPGRAFRTLAQEQLGYLLIEEAKVADAIAAFTALMQDQEAPEGLKRRAGQMITALGGIPPEANAVVDAG